MSQLQNIVTQFQNNDLVTAAKLNSLVTDTTITPQVITDQPPSSSSLVGSDVLLGYEAASGTLVAVDIDTIRTTSTLGDLKADTIDPVSTDQYSVLTIRNNNQGGQVQIRGNANVGGSVSIIGGGNGILLSTPNATRSGFNIIKMDSVPVQITENLEVRGDGVVGNLTSVVGSPIATITFSSRPPFENNPPIELKLDTPNAQFDGIALMNGTANWSGNTYTGGNTSSSPWALTITLPSNATQAYTNQPILVRRVALESKELSLLSRLHVRKESRFDGTANFNGAIQVSGTNTLQLKEVQELVMTTPWTATTAGFYDSIFTTALLTKPVNEVWVVSGFFHVNTTGYPTYVGIRFSNVTAKTGQYLTLNTFQDNANGGTVFDYNWDFNFVIPAATTFTDLSMRLDAFATNGSQARIGHTSSFQNMFGGATGPVWPQSRIIIHKYKA